MNKIIIKAFKQPSKGKADAVFYAFEKASNFIGKEAAAKALSQAGGAYRLRNFVLETINAKDKKYKVLNFDKITYAGNKSNLDSIKDSKNYSFVQGDICARVF